MNNKKKRQLKKAFEKSKVKANIVDVERDLVIIKTDGQAIGAYNLPNKGTLVELTLAIECFVYDSLIKSGYGDFVYGVMVEVTYEMYGETSTVELEILADEWEEMGERYEANKAKYIRRVK